MSAESQSGPVGGGEARHPTQVKPALSEAQRIERRRLLAKCLRHPDGLDRDVLKRIEHLTGDEQ